MHLPCRRRRRPSGPCPCRPRPRWEASPRCRRTSSSAAARCPRTCAATFTRRPRLPRRHPSTTSGPRPTRRATRPLRPWSPTSSRSRVPPSAGASPHMSSVGWQSPSHGASPSHSGSNFMYPDPTRTRPRCSTRARPRPGGPAAPSPAGHVRRQAAPPERALGRRSVIRQWWQVRPPASRPLGGRIGADQSCVYLSRTSFDYQSWKEQI